MIRDGTLSLSDINKILSRKVITSALMFHNSQIFYVRTLLCQLRELRPREEPGNLGSRIPASRCALSRCPPLDRFMYSCAIDRFIAVFKWMLPIYGALLFHLCFLSAVFAFKHNLHAYLAERASALKLPRAVVDSLISKTSFWFTGILAGPSLFVEE
jgi:hypothetical protein